MCSRSTSSRASRGAGSGRRDGPAENVRGDLERGAGREDDRALEDILQLADIARPGIGG